MGRNNKAKWTGIALTGLVIIATVIAVFVWAQADIKAVDIKAEGIKEDVGLLKAEGCLPARKNTNNITKIEAQLETMQDENRIAFREILRRLPDE